MKKYSYIVVQHGPYQWGTDGHRIWVRCGSVELSIRLSGLSVHPCGLSVRPSGSIDLSVRQFSIDSNLCGARRCLKLVSEPSNKCTTKKYSYIVEQWGMDSR